MKERPIIFNAEMVKAILDGRKTQTRRALTAKHIHLLNVAAQAGECYPLEDNHEGSQSYYRQFCPFGKIGDRLWVRETWAEAGGNAPELKLYRANYPAHIPSHYENIPAPEEIRWTPSIHMPRWASRINLEITNVRVERLNDISEADALAEGCVALEGCKWHTFEEANAGTPMHDHTAKDAFSSLWQSIYGEESWSSNPWVWVIEFKQGGAA